VSADWRRKNGQPEGTPATKEMIDKFLVAALIQKFIYQFCLPFLSQSLMQFDEFFDMSRYSYL
jgi:hypothetical protein